LDAYKSGRGRVVVRGKTDIETIDEKSKRSAIIIKEVLIAHYSISILISDVPTFACYFFCFIFMHSQRQACYIIYVLAQIPYQTNKATLVERIAELVEEKASLFSTN
jgi:DNA gyrase/topoisomerase IV subunit A